MSQAISLNQYLSAWAGEDTLRRAVMQTLEQLLAGTVKIADITSLGPLSGSLGTYSGTVNQGGDCQKVLDLQAHEILLQACQQSPVAVLGSEEAAEAILLDNKAPLVVVFDPLDGASNIETNAPIGSIFSLYPMPATLNASADEAVLQPGTEQLAAGYVIYSTQTALVLTVGEGTNIFVFDRFSGEYRLARKQVQIPKTAREYAVNASNHDFWHDFIQNYVQDCIIGYVDHKQKFNMRWIASLVAEAHRIFTRGGVFLYPGDSRKGYELGRLRLVYEANAMAFLMEQAGGAATDCSRRIMDIRPEHLHQRIPLVMGSEDNVAQVRRYHNLEEDGRFGQGQAPLFGSRGLFSSGRGNY